MVTLIQFQFRVPTGGRSQGHHPAVHAALVEDPHAGRAHVQPVRRQVQLGIRDGAAEEARQQVRNLLLFLRNRSSAGLLRSVQNSFTEDLTLIGHTLTVSLSLCQVAILSEIFCIFA